MVRSLADSNTKIQRRIWKAERIGWGVLAVLLLWALAGGAGNGLLADSRLGAAGMEMTYDRFTRRGVETPLVLQWPPVQGEIVISLEAGFVDAMGVDFGNHGLAVRRQGNAVLLSLDGSNAAGRLALTAYPRRVGALRTIVEMNGVPLGRAAIFVFP